jgi:Uncharacterized protein conserved in bacteria (DUF2188)
MTNSNQRHIVQHPDGGWTVKKPHALHASSRHSTQAQAQTRAKEILSHSGGGESVTHGRDGQIRDSDTVQPATADWSLLSPQGRVLFYIALCPGSTVEAIAHAAGHSQRSVWGIIRSLRSRGMLRLGKNGRRHHYAINLDAPLLHPTIQGLTIRPVMEGIARRARKGADDNCGQMKA